MLSEQSILTMYQYHYYWHASLCTSLFTILYGTWGKTLVGRTLNIPRVPSISRTCLQKHKSFKTSGKKDTFSCCTFLKCKCIFTSKMHFKKWKFKIFYNDWCIGTYTENGFIWPNSKYPNRKNYQCDLMIFVLNTFSLKHNTLIKSPEKTPNFLVKTCYALSTIMYLLLEYIVEFWEKLKWTFFQIHVTLKWQCWNDFNKWKIPMKSFGAAKPMMKFDGCIVSHITALDAQPNCIFLRVWCK